MLPDVHVICLESAFATRGKQTLAFVEAHLDKHLYNQLIQSKAITPSDFRLEDVVDTTQYVIVSGKQPRVTHADLDNTRQVACALSHVSIWRICVESQRPVVVFEDDVRPNNISQRLRQAQSFDSDVVLLSCAFSKKDSLTHKVASFTGAGCYYLTPQGASVLLKGAHPISMHIDHYMSTCIDAYDLRVFGVQNNNDQTKTQRGTTLAHGNVMAIVVPRLEIINNLLASTLALVILLGTLGLLLLKKRLNTQTTNYQTSSTSTNEKPTPKVAKNVKS
jgi:GR25 family glycosyltransferase involved in LPS biosynthesis